MEQSDELYAGAHCTDRDRHRPTVHPQRCDQRGGTLVSHPEAGNGGRPRNTDDVSGHYGGLGLTPILTIRLAIGSTLLIYGIAAVIAAVIFFMLARERPPTPPCPPGQEARSLVLDSLKQISPLPEARPGAQPGGGRRDDRPKGRPPVKTLAASRPRSVCAHRRAQARRHRGARRKTAPARSLSGPHKRSRRRTRTMPSPLRFRTRRASR